MELQRPNYKYNDIHCLKEDSKQLEDIFECINEAHISGEEIKIGEFKHKSIFISLK